MEGDTTRYDRLGVVETKDFAWHLSRARAATLSGGRRSVVGKMRRGILGVGFEPRKEILLGYAKLALAWFGLESHAISLVPGWTSWDPAS